MILSMVIVSWNTKDLLEKCISSILMNQPGGEYEIWVVDNASTDGSAHMVRENFPSVKLCESTENLGFARGNNMAIRQASGKYVLLLNPDTEVKPGALDTLIHFMDENPLAGGAGPYLLNPDGSLQASSFPIPTLAREFWHFFRLDVIFPIGVYKMKRWPTDHIRPVGYLKGACLILRHSALDQVGLLDEDYFMYTEEVDLCFRLQKAGWRLYWVPQAKVVHYGQQSINQVADEMFQQLYKTKIIFFRKSYGKTISRLYKVIILAMLLPRILLVSPLAWFKYTPKRDLFLYFSRNYNRLLLSLPNL